MDEIGNFILVMFGMGVMWLLIRIWRVEVPKLKEERRSKILNKALDGNKRKNGKAKKEEKL